MNVFTIKVFVRLCIAWLYRKEYCYYTQFLFMVIENVIISVDFGHKNDMSVETVFRIDKSRLIILSQRLLVVQRILIQKRKEMTI